MKRDPVRVEGISLPPSYWESLRARAALEGLSASMLVRLALERWARSVGVDLGAGGKRESPRSFGRARKFGMQLPPKLGDALARWSDRTGKTVASVAREAVALYIRDRLAGEPEFADVEEWRWIEEP